MRPISALLAISLVATVPATTLGQSDPTGLGLELGAGASDHVFELWISAAATWTAGEPIEVGGTLAYVGKEPAVTVTGSGSGLVFWGAEQLDGPIHAEPAWRSDLRHYDFETGDIETHAFTKSGGYGTNGPDAEFWSAWFDDPELRLPAGTWRIYALARYGLPGAWGENELIVDVEIQIVDDKAASAALCVGKRSRCSLVGDVHRSAGEVGASAVWRTTVRPVYPGSLASSVATERPLTRFSYSLISSNRPTAA